MLPDPAPGLPASDIRRFVTQLRNEPVHSTTAHREDHRPDTWHGCLINGRDTREASCPWLRASGSDSR
jgi:hypothetical protein